MSTATVEHTAPSTEAPCARFRKNKQGQWRVFGPESLVVEGPVTVTQMNGKTSIAHVQTVGKSFQVDGVAHRFGYLKPKPEALPTPAPVAAPAATSMSEHDFMPDGFEPTEFVPSDDAGDIADWE